MVNMDALKGHYKLLIILHRVKLISRLNNKRGKRVGIEPGLPAW